MQDTRSYTENPFEGTYNDVPITSISIAIEIDLREMIEDYQKHKKVVWTPQREEAFTKAKQAVYDCQKLFFVDEKATPILQTDASDYGIGGRL